MHNLPARLVMLFVAAILASLGLTVAVGVNAARADSWTEYEQLGTPQIKALAATSPSYVGGSDQPPAPTRLDVFGIGTDDALWYKRYADGAWSAYMQLGTERIKALAAASPSPTRLDVLAVGTDDMLWHKRYVDGTWSGYEQLDWQMPIKAVAATSSSIGRLDVFVINRINNTLWHKRYYNGNWSNYEPLGTEQIKAVAASSPSPPWLDVNVIRTDNTLWQKRRGDNSTWSSYQQRGVQKIKRLASAHAKCGTDYVFAISSAVGLENTLVYKSLGASWSAYRQLGTPEIKAVAATSPSPGRLDMFAIGTDDALWHKSGAYQYFPEGPC